MHEPVVPFDFMIASNRGDSENDHCELAGRACRVCLKCKNYKDAVFDLSLASLTAVPCVKKNKVLDRSVLASAEWLPLREFKCCAVDFEVHTHGFREANVVVFYAGTVGLQSPGLQRHAQKIRGRHTRTAGRRQD